jgi:hypothetical protein
MHKNESNVMDWFPDSTPHSRIGSNLKRRPNHWDTFGAFLRPFGQGTLLRTANGDSRWAAVFSFFHDWPGGLNASGKAFAGGGFAVSFLFKISIM